MSVSVNEPWGTPGVYLDPVTFESSGYPFRDPPETSSRTDVTRYCRKTRSAPSSPAYIDGFRYSSIYSTRVVQIKTQAGSAYRWPEGNRWSKHTPSVDPARWSNISRSGGNASAALASLKLAAERGALDRLNNTHIEAGVSLVESRKTLNHLSSSAIRLMSIIRNIRKGRFSAAASDLGLKISKRAKYNLASNWLEYQYAWLPLLSDIHATYQIVQQGLDKPLLLRAVRDLKSTVTSNVSRWERRERTSIQWETYTVSRPVEYTAGVKVTLYARVNSSELAMLKAFGLANPLSIAWELVPWSFVLDWFLPVGEFLNALTAPLGLTFVDGCHSSYVVCDTTIDDWGFSGTFTKSKPSNGSSVTFQTCDFSRGKYQNFPSPVLSRAPHLATKKLVTAAALYRQLR